MTKAKTLPGAPWGRAIGGLCVCALVFAWLGVGLCRAEGRGDSGALRVCVLTVGGCASTKPVQRKQSIWPVSSSIPFVVSLAGGAAGLIAGFSLQAAGIPEGAALVSGGLSFFFTASSSLMLWYPSVTRGVVGILLGATSVVGAGLILGNVVQLDRAYGWGLLAATAGHAVFNILGWINYVQSQKQSAHLRRLMRQRKRRKNPGTSPISALPSAAGVVHLGRFD